MKPAVSFFAWMVLFSLPALSREEVPTGAASLIVVNETLDQKVNRQIEFFLDETNTLGVEKVLGKREGWNRPDSDNLTFGLQTTTLWLKLHFKNEAQTKKTVYLEFNPVFLERIEAFDAQGKSLDISGSTVHVQRTESFPTIQFDVPAGDSMRFVSIKSRSNSLAVRVRSDVKQKAKFNFDLAVFCLLFGCLLMLMVYHLFLFGTYRNWIYFFYSLFIAATIHFTVSFCSFHKVLLPDAIGGFHVDFWWSALSAPLLLLSMYLFSAKLLSFFPSRPLFASGNWSRTALLALPLADVFCVLGVFITNDPVVLLPIRLSGLIHMLVLPSVAISIWLRDRSNTISLYYAVSWIPFALGAFLIVAWLSGAVGHSEIFPWSLPIGALFQSLLLSFAAGQQLNVVTREKLRLMKELEVEVNKLSHRDRVITTFVSSDVVDELDRGEDPLLYQPRNMNKSIVFIDMRNYTTFFETYSAFDCQKIINEYFRVISDTTYAGGGKVDKIIGDAMMLEFSNPTTALRTVVELRRNLSKTNKDRYEKKQRPLKFGTGVSYGTMLSANFGSSHKYDRTLVGDPVNVASRLEGITKQFEVDVLCSKEFIDLQHSYEYYRPAGYVMLKGKKKKSLVYEIFEHQSASVVEWKLSTKTRLHEAVELELAGKYVEALAVIQALIDSCPPHRNKPDAIMDLTLVAIINAIAEKMRQLELHVPTVETIQTKQEYKRAG